MFQKYPAVAGAALICLGVGAARFVSFQWVVWSVVAFLSIAFGVWSLLRARRRSGRSTLPSAAILLALMCAAALRFETDRHVFSLRHVSRFTNGEAATLVCEIADEPRLSHGRILSVVHLLRLISDSLRTDVDGDALLVVPVPRGAQPDAAMRYGDIITLTGTIEAPSGSRNPGEFSYRDYLALNDIYAVITNVGKTPPRVLESGSPGWIFASIILPSRHFVTRVARDVISGDAADFLTGILLGDRTDISTEIKQAFINTGTIHILAVSGSHVVLVVAIMYIFFGLFRLPERPKILATIVGILYYMELTGASPSVVRASLMGIVVLLAKLFQQRSNVYNSLGASALLLFLYDPKQMFDVGCQLSYAAVFSMAYFYPKLALLIRRIPESLEEVKGVDYVLKLFAVSLAAQIGTIPFTAYYFGRVSLVCFVANLLVVPLSGAVITIGFISVLAGTISLWLASFFSEVNDLAIFVTLRFVLLAGSVPYATVATPAFGARETIWYVAGVALLFHLRSPIVVRRTFLSLLAAVDLLLLVPESTAIEEGKLRVMFIDVGQGDAVLLLGPSGDALLIDAGPRNPSHDAGSETVVPLLRRLGVAKLDAVVLTHPHSDHIGGIPSVLRSLPVGMIVESGQKESGDLYEDFVAASAGIQRKIVRAGDVLDVLKRCRVYVVHPVQSSLDADSTDGYKDLNGTSVVLKVVYGTTSFLLPGDADIPVEEHLLRTYDDFLGADVLKAGHHGSRTSSCEAFLRAVQPREVVISVGRLNTFGHPSKETLARIHAITSELDRTDEEGAVLYESDGRQVRHVPWRQPL